MAWNYLVIYLKVRACDNLTHIICLQVFPGNTNSRSAQFFNTNGTLLATRVRIIPVVEGRHAVCLRLEFYGCPRDGIATYTIPQGWCPIVTIFTVSSGSTIICYGYPDGLLESLLFNHLLIKV